MSVLLSGLYLISGCRHRQISSAWYNFDRAAHLPIVRGDEDTVSRDSAVCRGDYLKPQLQFNKLPVIINERYQRFERRFVGDKILEGLEHQFVYYEIIRLQLTIEVNALSDPVPANPDHAVIHEFA